MFCNRREYGEGRRVAGPIQVIRTSGHEQVTGKAEVGSFWYIN